MALNFIRETVKRPNGRYALYTCTLCGRETEKRMWHRHKDGER